MPYYAVKVGRLTGIYKSWEECEKQIKGFSRAKFKKFTTLDEANDFLLSKITVSKATDSNVADNFEVVYTDGSSLGNGKSGSRAGYGLFFKDDDPRNKGYRLEGDIQTNQRSELMAAIKALEIVESSTNLLIRTDSNYLVRGMNSWIKSWKLNEWNIPVKNMDLFKRLDKIVTERTGMVRFEYVKAHSGIYGNEMADKLAKEGALKNRSD